MWKREASTLFQLSLLVFHDRNSVMQAWNDMRKEVNHVHFHIKVNYPFKSSIRTLHNFFFKNGAGLMFFHHPSNKKTN